MVEVTASQFPPLDDLLQHRMWVRHLARSLVRDVASADDVEQQVWLAALRSPPREPGSPRAWLATVTRNAVRRLHRTEQRRQGREQAVAARTEPSGEPPDRLVQRAETHRAVVDAVLDLPEPLRRAILLRYFEDRPVAEVARRLGVPLETARSRLRIARDRLRARFAPDVETLRASGLLALAGAAVDGLRDAAAGGISTASQGAAAFSTTTMGVLTMTTATKLTAAVSLAAVLGLGLAWMNARDEAGRLSGEREELRDRVARLEGSLSDAESERDRLRRAEAVARQHVDSLEAERIDVQEELARLRAARTDTAPGARAADDPPQADPAESRSVQEPSFVTPGQKKKILAALRAEPDSELHAWAIAQLLDILLGDSATQEWKWAAGILEDESREGNVGPEEAAGIESAYLALPEGSAAAPLLAAATAVGWTRDPRLDGFLSGIPARERKSVHLLLLRTLDRHPTAAFTNYLVRLVREEEDPEVLKSAFDEDRAAAAATTADRARDVVAAFTSRLRDPRLPDRHRRKGYYSLSIAGLLCPAYAATALRDLAAALPADDAWREPLTRAAALFESGETSARDLERLFD